jgi:hypothetical protein
VLELEGLLIGITGKMAPWETLADLEGVKRLEIDFAQMSSRAAAQRSAVDDSLGMVRWKTSRLSSFSQPRSSSSRTFFGKLQAARLGVDEHAVLHEDPDGFDAAHMIEDQLIERLALRGSDLGNAGHGALLPVKAPTSRQDVTVRGLRRVAFRLHRS